MKTPLIGALLWLALSRTRGNGRSLKVGRVMSESTFYGRGTMPAVAPEVLLSDTGRGIKTVYGPAIDMWSVGCIFAEMLRRGKPILPGMSEVDQLIKILKLCGTPEQGPGWVQYLDANLTEETKERVLNLPKYPRCVRETFKKYPDDMVDLLDKILRINPSERISLQEARDHPFFTNGDKIILSNKVMSLSVDWRSWYFDADPFWF